MLQLIKNANLFDGFSPQLQKNVSVVIRDNLVQEIATGAIAEDQFDRIIDAGGRTVMPGIVEGHGHMSGVGTKLMRDQMREDEIVVLSVRYAQLLLNSGITTVRDGGSLVYGLKAGIDKGIIDGPRIFPSHAALSQTCGHGDGRTNRAQLNTPFGSTSPYMRAKIMETCDGAPEITRKVRDQLFLGASQIKIMAGGGMSTNIDPLETLQFTLEEQKLIVGLAKDYGTYVMAHLYTPAQIKRSAEAGVMSFEHATFMDDECGHILSDMGAWVCPCPNSISVHFEEKMKKMSPLKRSFAERMPVALMQQAEIINKYGINVIFGTDGKHNPVEDLATYQDRFGALNGLKMATGNAKELFKLCTYQNPYPDGYIGTLEPGSYADLLIMDGDPTTDLTIFKNLDNMKLIMKDGKVYKNIL